MQDIFIHHVFFWLNEPENLTHKEQLIEGLQKLATIKIIKSFHIGKPAATDRDVIDNTYDVSWMLFFASAVDQESYQTNPIHLKFIDECSPVWRKVLVYDTLTV